MTFRPDALPQFRQLFADTAPHIRAFPGCVHLELWEDVRFSNILSTYSVWTGTDALQDYRDSDLFRETWAITREWFAAPPVALSQSRLAEVSPDAGE